MRTRPTGRRRSITLIRKFKFQTEIHGSLSCLPMAARRQLDAVGIKLQLAQWELLARGERLMICYAPADAEEQRRALGALIEEVAPARTGSLPETRFSSDRPRSPKRSGTSFIKTVLRARSMSKSVPFRETW
jgi:hypothetical protein